ncbi:MAG TPA: type II toxin-antitoxin system VapC family toxin [Stellaceae bacterium]|nr:type II toxin-antitoxin system VapC family toxin [Stellaceae bacterium]
MIILDTNVISEAMRDAPTPAVAGWLNDQPVSDLATTTINIAEIKHGFALLGESRRRAWLEGQFDRLIARTLGSRVHEFDALAAEAFAELAAIRRRLGRPLAGFDGLIASIAASRGASLATRDVGDFADCGVLLINPWDAPAS